MTDAAKTKSKGQRLSLKKSRGWSFGLVLSLLAVVGLLAANTMVVDSKTRPAEARDGGEAGIVPANVKVEGSGPPIVLIHGFGAALDWWDEIAPALAAGNRVIRIDLIGHGGTEAPASGYSIERQASLVSGVRKTQGVDRFILIGHSMGGEVATAVAEANPGKVERLIDTPPKLQTTFNLGTKLAFTPVIGELISRFTSDTIIRKMLGQGFAPGFPVPEKFVAAPPMTAASNTERRNRFTSGLRHSIRFRRFSSFSAPRTRSSRRQAPSSLRMFRGQVWQSSMGRGILPWWKRRQRRSR